VKIGLVGLGVMGGHMARHFARAHELVVFDVDPGKVSAVVGAQAASSVADVGSRSEVVLLSLPGSAIVEQVVTGADGLMSSLGSGGAVIDTSTTEPTVSKRIAARLAERGIEFLDAPVSGGEGGARDATLSVMAGGSQAVFDRYKPLLEVVGKSVIRVGETGSGGVAKLINNMIVGSTFAVIAETFALGKTCGLDPAVLYDAIKGGWAGSAVLDVAAPGIIKRDFTPGGTIDILFKDIGYALSLAREHNVPTPMTALTDEILKAARASGRGSKAQQIIIQMWEGALGLDTE
jgi:2-hydroxy-3-oxopropionate reductase